MKYKIDPISPVTEGSDVLTNPAYYLVCPASWTAPDTQYYPWHFYNCLNGIAQGELGLKAQSVYKTGIGKYVGYQLFDWSPYNGSQTPDGINTILQSALNSGVIPSFQDYLSTIYVLFLPEEITSTLLCAWHTALDDGTPYIVLPYPSDTGCNLYGTLDTLNAFTILLSHEYVESITDPRPGNGVTENNGEVDDFYPCLWTPIKYTVNGYTYTVQGFDLPDGTCWEPSQAITSATPLAIPPAPV